MKRSGGKAGRSHRHARRSPPRRLKTIERKGRAKGAKGASSGSSRGTSGGSGSSRNGGSSSSSIGARGVGGGNGEQRRRRRYVGDRPVSAVRTSSTTTTTTSASSTTTTVGWATQRDSSRRDTRRGVDRQRQQAPPPPSVGGRIGRPTSSSSSSSSAPSLDSRDSRIRIASSTRFQERADDPLVPSDDGTSPLPGAHHHLASHHPPPRDLSCRAWIAVDATDGTVMGGSQVDMPLPIASIAKVRREEKEERHYPCLLCVAVRCCAVRCGAVWCCALLCVLHLLFDLIRCFLTIFLYIANRKAHDCTVYRRHDRKAPERGSLLRYFSTCQVRSLTPLLH